MSRQSHTQITSGLPNWDADVNTDFTLIFTDPLPLADFANDAALPTASTNDDSFAVTTDTSQLWVSDGTDWVAPSREHITIAVGDETTVIAVSTDVVTFRMPYAFKLEDIRASLNVAAVTGTVTVDVHESGTTIMTTDKLDFDNTETTTTTASTPPALTDVDLADDAEISIDIDSIGSGEAAGLKVTLIGRQVSV